MTAADLVIGLTASGRTPYVGGALAQARSVGAFTVLMIANPQAELCGLVDVALAPATGAEALTGSTRLKAGTAEKLMLNGFSTVLMMRLGRVYSNLMIDMRATNAKLRGRSVELLSQATGAAWDDCSSALLACGDIKTALVLLLSGLDPEARGHSQQTIRGSNSPAAWNDHEVIRRCREALEQAHGVVRQALLLLQPPP